MPGRNRRRGLESQRQMRCRLGEFSFSKRCPEGPISTTSPGVDQPWARPCPQKLLLVISSIRQARPSAANFRVGSVAVYLALTMRNFGLRRTSRNNLTENGSLPFPNRQEPPRPNEQTTRRGISRHPLAGLDAFGED